MAIGDELGDDFRIFASRADLFAAHYVKGVGFATPALLADEDVVYSNGPGDVPPIDDYPVEPDDDIVVAEPTPPQSLTFGGLSRATAARTRARNYVYWARAQECFDEFRDLVHVNTALRDEAFLQADAEVFVAIKREPTRIDDYRSFDLMLDIDSPRVRINVDGAAFAFAFKRKDRDPKKNLDAIVAALAKCDLAVGPFVRIRAVNPPEACSEPRA